MRSPKIRFKGYSEDWEQRKLGEITELKSASRVHKGEWTSNGVPFYRSSDVMAAINGTENEKALFQKNYMKSYLKYQENWKKEISLLQVEDQLEILILCRIISHYIQKMQICYG